MKFKVLFLLITFTISFLANAQERPSSTQIASYNWFNLDPGNDLKQGVSTEKAYAFLKAHNKKSKPVIVAIIDSGVDIDHEDLKDIVWVNEDEIPGNGIDDDHNGYIDDIHGWNFLGNAKGENINHESLELTRIYAIYKKRFDGVSPDKITSTDKKDYQTYLDLQNDYLTEFNKAAENKMYYEIYYNGYIKKENIMKQVLGKDTLTLADVQNFTSDVDSISQACERVRYYLENNLLSSLKTGLEYYSDRIDYNLNLEYNPRSLVGDDPFNINDTNYGNADVKGPDCGHGTHVSGIVAAIRNNNLGIEGIADNVRIMVIRAVPDGDERDKDVALAIRYAVNNGAQIINMSFGKKYSPQKQWVDDAVKLALSKGVLMIHAAGNEGENIDKETHYPSNSFLGSKKTPKNWITVGASSDSNSSDLPAFFSNYGAKTVDLFAPGVDIYSTIPGNAYDNKDGTSMACPVVTGVAALVWSYYPQLTAVQLKKILMKSVYSRKRLEVLIPNKDGDRDKTLKFSKLCVSGGLVNAYNAIQLAEKECN